LRSGKEEIAEEGPEEGGGDEGPCGGRGGDDAAELGAAGALGGETEGDEGQGDEDGGVGSQGVGHTAVEQGMERARGATAGAVPAG